jgi:phage/plasmid-associated DNA primase
LKWMKGRVSEKWSDFLKMPSKVNSLVNPIIDKLTDEAFVESLDGQPHLFPLANNKVIDFRTGVVRGRTEDDALTFTTECNMLVDLEYVQSWSSSDVKDAIPLLRQNDNLNAVMKYLKDLTMKPKDRAKFNAFLEFRGECKDETEINKQIEELEWEDDEAKLVRVCMLNGYSVTGEVNLNNFYVGIGPRGTGKSVYFRDVWRDRVLGKHLATNVDSKVFASKQHEDESNTSAHTAAINNVELKRQIWADELEPGAYLKARDIKQKWASGNTFIKIRNLGLETRDAPYRGKCVLTTNVTYQIPKAFADVRSNIEEIEFAHVIVKEKAENLAYIENTVKSSWFRDQMFTLSALWAVRFYKNGRSFPKVRTNDTAVLYAQDSVTDFVRDCLIVDKSHVEWKIHPDDLYKAYLWYMERDEKRSSQMNDKDCRHRMSEMFDRKKKRIAGKDVWMRSGVKWNIEYFNSRAWEKTNELKKYDPMHGSRKDYTVESLRAVLKPYRTPDGVARPAGMPPVSPFDTPLVEDESESE